ncbi:hypothetical protein ILUMI_23134 [Ignelater luminosus]|uniref:Uncharacterized protein n=1 Tax=Ignelater luminosus TaxID=2038154 RepID=A0A8K0CF92_IGNLU|nr:hypothetical protein ILUMI_23134 [Ignelater luminosus]
MRQILTMLCFINLIVLGFQKKKHHNVGVQSKYLSKKENIKFHRKTNSSKIQNPKIHFLLSATKKVHFIDMEGQLPEKVNLQDNEYTNEEELSGIYDSIPAKELNFTDDHYLQSPEQDSESLYLKGNPFI